MFRLVCQNLVQKTGVRSAHLNGNQVRTGMALLVEGKLFRVTKSQSVKPGKGGAYMQAELKDMKTGTKSIKRFRSTENVERAEFGPSEHYQYLYTEGKILYLMNNETFDQVEISSDMFSKTQANFLEEGMDITIQRYEDEPIHATMPDTIIAEVKDTPPPDSTLSFSKSNFKIATISSGAEVRVPPFITNGNHIKVCTETGDYLSKA